MLRKVSSATPPLRWQALSDSDVYSWPGESPKSSSPLTSPLPLVQAAQPPAAVERRGAGLRTAWLVLLYCLCAALYAVGVTAATTAVTRFPGTPLQHTDLRSGREFLHDTYAKGWWFAFWVLLVTGVAIPATKFLANLLVIWDVFQARDMLGPVSGFCHRFMHVACTYQMADAFCASLLTSSLNTWLTEAQLCRGFFAMTGFVVCSVVFQQGAEVMMLPSGQMYPRIHDRVDRLGVAILASLYGLAFWLCIGSSAVEVSFQYEGLVLQRSPASLWSTLRSLREHVPLPVWLLYVFLLVIAPNLYVAALLVVAFATGERGSAGSEPWDSLRSAAEAVCFLARPWAMFDEFVLMLWVIVFTIHTEFIDAAEAPAVLHLTSLRFLTLAALALFALRWHWFQAPCGRLLRGRIPLVPALVLLLWLLLCLVQTPQPVPRVGSMQSLNDWIAGTAPQVNSLMGRRLPAVQGNCSSYHMFGSELQPGGACRGESSIFTYKTEEGTELEVEWVADLNTLRLASCIVEVGPGSSYSVTLEAEMQFLAVKLSGKFCTGLCADLDSVLTWGRRHCAKEGEVCECEGGHLLYGNVEANEFAPPIFNRSLTCSSDLWGPSDGNQSDPEAADATARAPPAPAPSAGRRSCYCSPPGAIDAAPRRLRVQLAADCQGGSCPGSLPLDNLTIQEVELNRLEIRTTVTIFGWIPVERNWTEASGLLADKLHDFLEDYAQGRKRLPLLNQPILTLVNRVMLANAG